MSSHRQNASSPALPVPAHANQAGWWMSHTIRPGTALFYLLFSIQLVRRESLVLISDPVIGFKLFSFQLFSFELLSFQLFAFHIIIR
jgi:hypothetical protein